MTDWKLLDREQRAVLLAATAKIKNVGDKWLVPSQSESGVKYVVDLGGESPRCNCPDHELRACRCKHLIAVEIVRQRELFEDGSEQVTQTVTVTETVPRRPIDRTGKRTTPRRRQRSTRSKSCSTTCAR